MAVSYRVLFGTVLMSFQIIFVVLFGFFVDYDQSANAMDPINSRDPDKNGSDPSRNMVKEYYPMFQDVHVMMFIGFGFLMTFLKRYGYSSVAINMLIGSFVIQWAILMGGFLHLHHGRIEVGITNMLTADFAAAAVLITFGAVLGKTSPLQMIFVAFIEIIFFSVNEYIGVYILQAVDMGGSMFVHVFGAYFGLALARMLYTKEAEDCSNEGAVYQSDIFSMIGTIFLWLFWPSFNSALAPGDDQHRAVINTYLALASCCVATFAISALINKRGKLDMVHVQNATLAGGVAVGTCADMMILPSGALAIGVLAGVLSVLGFSYVQPFLASKAKLHDTCGVNNLHGMPGLFAGICGAVVASLASEAQYGYSLYQIFPARAPVFNSTDLHTIESVFSAVSAGSGRSGLIQGGYQMLALVVTLCMATIGGVITGLLMKLDVFSQPKGGHNKPMMDDTLWWETPEGMPYAQLPTDQQDSKLAMLMTKDGNA